MRRLRARFFLVLLLVLTPALLPAAGRAYSRLDGSTIPIADVDAAVERLMASAEVPGVALALFDDGKVVHSRGYGFRNRDQRLPVTEDTVFGGASFTKVAFAYLVMKLVDARVIDLDEPLEAYLPQPLPSYPRYADLADDARYRKLTAASC